MGMARYVVDAVVLEGRSVREVARAHGLSKTWIYELLGRYRAGGYEALEPRSRRPRSCPHQTPGELVDEILRLRRELQDAGHDCGPATIRYHLAAQREDPPSRATIWRILKREGLIVSQPQKRPHLQPHPLRSRPPQRDVADGHHRLAARRRRARRDPQPDRRPLRLFLGSDAYHRVKAADVVSSFHKAAQLHGLPRPCSPTTAPSSPAPPATARSCCNQNSSVSAWSSRTHAPITPRPAERSSACTRHSSATSPSSRQPPHSTELQAQLETFAHYYNHIRPHRALGGQTPLQAYSARIKARPAGSTPNTHFRVREDKVDKTGKVSLRHQSRLYKIGYRQSPQRPPDQAPHRRPEHPRDRPQRPAHPRAHTRPKPQLPAPQPHLDCPRSPKTRVRDARDITKRRGRDSNPRWRKNPP